jgi:hypothetical protein
MYKLIGADGQEYGPVSAEMLRQWVAEGRANGLTRVLPENSTEWKLLRDLPDFAALFPATPSPAPPAIISVPEQKKQNPLALTGLILGILSCTFGLCCCGGLPFSLTGIVCSSIGLSQINKTPNQEGRGLAVAGLVLSIVGLLLGIVLMVFYGVMSTMPDVMKRIQRL